MSSLASSLDRSMEAVCVSILSGIQDPVPNDPIHDCRKHALELVNIGHLIDQPQKLFDFANERIHTFPYKDVLPCWFRLYTDASIVRAIAKIRVLQAKQALQSTRNYDEELQLLDEAIFILDMALIMAGGAGRKSEIQDLFRSLPALQKTVDEHKDAELHKKSKSMSPGKRLKAPQIMRANATKETDDELCLVTHSLPTIQNGMPRISQPAVKWFERHMHEQKSPIIIKDAMNHWEGLKSWTKKSYWLEQTLDGRRRIPIEVGRSYTDDNWGQQIVTFRYFLERHIYPKVTSTRDEGTRTASPSLEDDEKDTGYLAQHDLFEQIPGLYGAIATPEYCFWDPPPAEDGTPVALSKKRQGSHRLKTSHPSKIPIASITPISQDSVDHDLSNAPEADEIADADSSEVQRNNLVWAGLDNLATSSRPIPQHALPGPRQKYIRLYSPAYSQQLYPRSTEERTPHPSSNGELAIIDMSNTSTIDIAATELSPAEDWDEKYPGLSEVPYLDCVLEAGEMLYIPLDGGTTCVAAALESAFPFGGVNEAATRWHCAMLPSRLSQMNSGGVSFDQLNPVQTADDSYAWSVERAKISILS